MQLKTERKWQRQATKASKQYHVVVERFCFSKKFAVKRSNNIDIQKSKTTNPAQNETHAWIHTHIKSKSKKKGNAKKPKCWTHKFCWSRCNAWRSRRDRLTEAQQTQLFVFRLIFFCLYMYISCVPSGVRQANCVALSPVSLCCSARNLNLCRYYMHMYIRMRMHVCVYIRYVNMCVLFTSVHT